MLTLKFQKIGKKKQAHFRLIIQEKSKNPKSNVLEILGWYNPVLKTKELKTERIQYWLDKGATTTVTVHNFLITAGLIKEEKLNNIKISKARKDKMAVKAKEQAAKLAEATKKEEVVEEVKPEIPAETVTEEIKEEIKAE